jgi:glycosyltransferase involved in cell wall biosynthesis
LTVVGRGPETDRLKAIARDLGADATFAGWIEDEDVRNLYRRSRAILMPGVEDFGMVPVEAQACGRPVVVLAQGGALESVVDGVTGLHVHDGSVDAFADALNAVSTRSWDSGTIRAHAETFGKARFQREFQDVVNEDKTAEKDPRDVSAQHPSNPAVVRNAARYREDRDNFADRETKQ